MKRCFDVMGASILFLIAAFPMFGIALALWLSGSESVFFCQWRLGYERIPFRIWKFRTMRVSEQDSTPADLVWSHQDDRVTAIGRVLRRTHLDELPQLWNVIWGDMSLVGPRPMTFLVWRECWRQFSWSDRRFSVKPGMTGLAQICGRQMLLIDPERARRLDNEYAEMEGSWRRLWCDVRILWCTIPAVFFARGV